MEIGRNDLPSVVHFVERDGFAHNHGPAHGLLLVVYLVLGVGRVAYVDCMETVVVVACQ